MFILTELETFHYPFYPQEKIEKLYINFLVQCFPEDVKPYYKILRVIY